MSLRKCKECSKEISSTATSCPQCGAQQPKRTTAFTWIVGGIFTLFVARCAFMEPTQTATPIGIQATATDQTTSIHPPSAPRNAAEVTALKRKEDASKKAAAKLEVANRKAETIKKKREGVAIGMNKADVIASSWGKPQKINTTTNARGSHEQWVYGGGYLYFEDGILTSIQN